MLLKDTVKGDLEKTGEAFPSWSRRDCEKEEGGWETGWEESEAVEQLQKSLRQRHGRFGVDCSKKGPGLGRNGPASDSLWSQWLVTAQGEHDLGSNKAGP